MSNSKSQFRRSSRSAIDKTTRTSNFSVVLARSAERPRRSVVSRIADRGQADLTQPALGICSVHIDKTKAHKNRIENCWPQQLELFGGRRSCQSCFFIRANTGDRLGIVREDLINGVV
ncbi:hypothetical protein PI126_g18856 [Phytophthora idaei]|nr:hypothetical protein PI126_g18856 [Phytophthora idaei]